MQFRRVQRISVPCKGSRRKRCTRRRRERKGSRAEVLGFLIRCNSRRLVVANSSVKATALRNSASVILTSESH
ncbi:hypothetical protein U1Q18_029764 [Sarracenia purpurea var. burkii]